MLMILEVHCEARCLRQGTALDFKGHKLNSKKGFFFYCYKNCFKALIFYNYFWFVKLQCFDFVAKHLPFIY